MQRTRVRRPAEALRGAGDEGLALVVALLVTMITFILVTAVLAQAVHNVTQSGYLRRRTAAIHAAEAGLNWYSNLLGKATLPQLTGSGWSYNAGTGWWTRTTSVVATSPDRSTFTIRVKYTAADVCATTPCSASGLAPQELKDPFPEPAYAIVRSIGTAGVSASTGSVCTPGEQAPGCVTRVLESALRIHAQTGGLGSGTGLLGTSLCFDSGADLTVDGSVHVLDLPDAIPAGFPCTTGGVQVLSGNKLTVLNGNLYIDDQGLTVSGGGYLYLSDMVWAEGAVTIGASTGAGVDVCGPQTNCVNGDALGSTVTVGSGSVVLGEQVECDPPCPPTEQTFPKLTDDAAIWANWTPLTASSGSDALAKAATASGKTVIRISSTTSPTCDTVFSGTVTISGDVAIVSQCKFVIDAQNGGGGLHIAGTGSLSLVSKWPGTAASPDPVTCTGSRNINVSNNPTIDPAIFFYTPCVLILENNSSIPVEGQFVARYILIKNGVKIGVTNLLGEAASVPGFLRGFRQDVRYIKEIMLAAALGA